MIDQYLRGQTDKRTHTDTHRHSQTPLKPEPAQTAPEPLLPGGGKVVKAPPITAPYDSERGVV